MDPQKQEHLASEHEFVSHLLIGANCDPEDTLEEMVVSVLRELGEAKAALARETKAHQTLAQDIIEITGSLESAPEGSVLLKEPDPHWAPVIARWRENGHDPSRILASVISRLCVLSESELERQDVELAARFRKKREEIELTEANGSAGAEH